MNGVIHLKISYTIWKQLAQNHSWSTYHYDDGVGSRQCWTGDRDHVYETRVDAEDFSDWDTSFGGSSVVVVASDDAEAQIVGLSGLASRPLSVDGTPSVGKQQLELGRIPFRHKDTNSEAMNVDGVAAGTPVVLWNGTGTLDSGGDWTHGDSGTETTASAKSGTNGLDSGVRITNDKTTFDNGSEVDIVDLYSELTFWMQPKAFPPNAKLRVLWRNSVGTKIGSAVNVANYVSNMDLDKWKSIQIPIEDFDLTAAVQKLELQYRLVDGQQFWFDDIEVTSSSGGGPHVFQVAAPAGLIYHVERAALVLSAPNTGWSGDAFANITGGLGRGLLLRYKKIGAESETYWKVNAQNNAELFGQFQVINDVSFDNGDRQFTFALEPQLSSVVLVDDDEVLDIVVRDDLSALASFRAFLHFGVEELPT